MNFQMFKMDLEKAEEPEINFQHPLDHRKARKFQKNIYFCFIDYAKAFDSVDHNKLWKVLQKKGIPASWEIWMQVKMKQLEPDMKQQTDSKFGKDYIKAVYCHPDY